MWNLTRPPTHVLVSGINARTIGCCMNQLCYASSDLPSTIKWKKLDFLRIEVIWCRFHVYASNNDKSYN